MHQITLLMRESTYTMLVLNTVVLRNQNGSPWLRIGRIVHIVAEILKEKHLETNLIKSITKAREIISMVKSTYCFCKGPTLVHL